MINVHFSEIFLKGKNRRVFENLLIRNIRSSLDGSLKVSIVKKDGRILISAEDEDAVKNVLLKTFGVDSVKLSGKTTLDIEDMKSFVIDNSKPLIGKAIRINTRRANKNFPMNSQRVNEIIGKILVDSGCTVNLKKPDETVFIEILSDMALISFNKDAGPGGLPVGSSGKVLSLLSGGIDSPVSSLLMMKRGCVVDFLHLHSSASNTDIKNTKIIEILKTIRCYSPNKLRLFVMPYSEFYKKTFSIDPRKEMVVFRRFLVLLANELAKEHGYKGIVTGDSIGQVASQTLDNLFATNEVSQIPLFRPLIGLNKQEIIDLAVKFGTYDASIKPYKDCCSLVAHKSPSTSVGVETAKKIEQEIEIGEVVNKTLKLCDVIEI